MRMSSGDSDADAEEIGRMLHGLIGLSNARAIEVCRIYRLLPISTALSRLPYD
jgi:hypothetical protein